MPGTSSDFWHQPSWNTKHCAAAFSQISPFPTLQFLSHSLFCSLFHFLFPQLCSSSAIWLTAEADSGMEGIRWFQPEKLHSFCILLWTPPLSSCYFYSYTTKGQVWKNQIPPFSKKNKHFFSLNKDWNIFAFFDPYYQQQSTFAINRVNIVKWTWIYYNNLCCCT